MTELQWIVVKRGKRAAIRHALTTNGRTPCSAHYTEADAMAEPPQAARMCAGCERFVAFRLPRLVYQLAVADDLNEWFAGNRDEIFK